MDNLTAIMLIEGGDPDTSQAEFFAAFQQLIDANVVWQLQGFYGRAARSLIEDGHCVDTHDVLGLNPHYNS